MCLILVNLEPSTCLKKIFFLKSGNKEGFKWLYCLPSSYKNRISILILTE
jgi:hypothetical protein